QNDATPHGSFSLLDGETVAGELTYTWAGESMLIIDATDVNETYRGQGVGRQLLDALVAFGREKDVKVIPLCPDAQSVFDKDPSLGDVLRK
ncbi:GNAT family N-acetyltransferase, partial [Acinetobacter baumannii]|uniref:GNAT family N-acetyltransferase n=1 Tax=Acinetobacter baumannii TaxID=470 RepID=UPI003AF709A0